MKNSAGKISSSIGSLADLLTKSRSGVEKTAVTIYLVTCATGMNSQS
ncbi:hypothetical protein [Arsenophonus apicola]